MLDFKDDVQSQQPLVRILLAAHRVWKQHGYEVCTVTSLNDSQHSTADSGHYQDRAADLRSRDLKREDIGPIVEALRTMLGIHYFVQFEPQIEGTDEAGKKVVKRYEHIHAQRNKESA